MSKYLHKFFLNKSSLNIILDEININEKIDVMINDIEDKYSFLKNFTKKIVERENTKGYKMKWHLDDCVPFYNKNGLDYKCMTNITIISDNLYLYHTKKRPIYTLLLYLSDIDVDFKGGELCFVDKIIKPKKGLYVLFDNNTIHKVNEIKEGTRKCIIVKYY